MTMTERRGASSRRRSAITCSSKSSRPLFSIQLIITLLSVITIPVAGTPVSYFPLNSQLPPVARVSKPFSFVFSPLTFSSDSEINYSLGGGSPSWLSLDSASRTLSGTPDKDSVPRDKTLVGVDIVLVAHDKTGSTTANATLVVSRGPGPIVQMPLENQIKRFGAYSPPASILLHPSTEFSFKFDPKTFGVDAVEDGDTRRKTLSEMRQLVDIIAEKDRRANADEQPLSYYAVSGNNAPLPSWIEFDAAMLEFSGTTPSFESLVQPPQSFGFQLVASDVVGFSSVAIDFSIVVGTHELTALEPIIELKSTRGKEFEYTDLPNVLEIDNRPLKNDDVSSITANDLPDWLSFDKESWKISGKPGAEEKSTNVTITVMDEFLDTLNVTLAITFKSNVFLSDLPVLNVSAGDDLSLDLKKFLVHPADTQIKAEIPSNSSWLTFDDSKQVLSGTAPKHIDPDFADDIRVTFEATQRHTKDQETKHLNIHVDASTSTNGISKPTHTPKPDNKSEDWRRDLYWLLIIPALLIAAGSFLVVFLIRRRRQQPKKLDFSFVSGPVPGSLVANGAMGASTEPPQKIRHTKAVQPLAPSTRPGASVSKVPSNLRTTQVNPATKVVAHHCVTGGYHCAQPVTPVRPGTTESARANPVTAAKNRLSGRPGKPSPAVTEEFSLLSDTSVGEEVPLSEEHLSSMPGAPRGSLYGQRAGLEIPTITESLSVQLTPELAYMDSTKKYDVVSDDEMIPAIGYAQRRRSVIQRNTENGTRRHSKGWKRGSELRAPDAKRNSQLSSFTDATARTSILASGIPEEATTARTSNILVKPTVIHIPSRPGEARLLSRRTHDSSTFFGGRSVTKSQRSYGLKNTDSAVAPTYASGFAKEEDATRESWDRDTARNSLGIPYNDLNPQTTTGRSHAPRIGMGLGEHWKSEQQNTGADLMSPERWPIPNAMTKTLKGKGKKRASIVIHRSPPSSTAASLASQTSSGATRPGWHDGPGSLRVNRIRAHAKEFRGRVPLAERTSNESTKRSLRRLRSNNKSVWGDDDDDDDDAWEDIVPPEEDGWEREGSESNFSVYI
ncbi:hypothetical protein GGR50DRAFT_88686 [Xylaria sp. CBS 124048]|nr:hypothetical protein GGR50DRAFT_88686 [Xylaria sp. CBS 124048]